MGEDPPVTEGSRMKGQGRVSSHADQNSAHGSCASALRNSGDDAGLRPACVTRCLDSGLSGRLSSPGDRQVTLVAHPATLQSLPSVAAKRPGVPEPSPAPGAAAQGPAVAQLRSSPAGGCRADTAPRWRPRCSPDVLPIDPTKTEETR